MISIFNIDSFTGIFEIKISKNRTQRQHEVTCNVDLKLHSATNRSPRICKLLTLSGAQRQRDEGRGNHDKKVFKRASVCKGWDNERKTTHTRLPATLVSRSPSDAVGVCGCKMPKESYQVTSRRIQFGWARQQQTTDLQCRIWPSQLRLLHLM